MFELHQDEKSIEIRYPSFWSNGLNFVILYNSWALLSAVFDGSGYGIALAVCGISTHAVNAIWIYCAVIY